jgi:hypothetical protein
MSSLQFDNFLEKAARECCGEKPGILAYLANVHIYFLALQRFFCNITLWGGQQLRFNLF